MSRTVYFVTSNENKLNEARQILGDELSEAVQRIDIDSEEIQALYVRQVVEKKVMDAYNKARKRDPAIKEGSMFFVEDTGLYINAWNGFPGAHVKWVLKAKGPPGICSLVKDCPDKSAYAETCIGLYDGNELKIFTGRVDGKIVDTPRGQTKFGWDPAFQPDGYDQTFAEMGIAKKNEISMRRKAFLQLKEYLESIGD